MDDYVEFWLGLKAQRPFCAVTECAMIPPIGALVTIETSTYRVLDHSYNVDVMSGLRSYLKTLRCNVFVEKVI